MIRAGIDVGSVNTKLVCFDTVRNEVVCRRVEPTGLRPKETARRVFAECLAEVGLIPEQLAAVTATGYARHSADFAPQAVTEIKAVARGIRHWHPSCRAIVDVGGQDSKIVVLDDDGVREFVMNDRCAAGTGNFLSVLARAMDVPLGQFGVLSGQSQRPAPISSLCVVMAESEILSLVAAEVAVADVVAGLHDALARRVASLAARLVLEPEVVFTGGVALNEGMRVALERALAMPVTVAPEPLYAAALGAALG
ncbi:2-hydroxyglutaryl-CoA dehydratase [candidate division WOR-3 bacterium]|nr:2-hydroxyglutaryl-CoA dehydratase [candidate division WOR-3 bacterium]